LVELAEIKPGQRVLDIATGIGEPAITAARTVGDKGHVIATDISTQMLAIGRERAIAQGLQNMIEFREGDAESVDLPNSSFEAVLSRWGLMFLPNLRMALDNIQKSLINGGRLAAAVWGEPDKVPFINLPMTFVREQLQLPPPPPGIPGPFSLADVDAFKNSLLESGFGDIHHENIDATFEYDSAEDYVRFIQDIAAPVNMMLANETEKRREEIWKGLTDQVRLKFEDSTSGRVNLNNKVICLVGRRQ
jgi:SAM-dependent methyltransferase